MRPRRPEFEARFRYIGYGLPIPALKRLLKAILRTHGFRCTNIREVQVEHRRTR